LICTAPGPGGHGGTDVDTAIDEVKAAEAHGLPGVLLPVDHFESLDSWFLPRYNSLWGTLAALEELEALARLGLVARDDSRSGVGGRWTVTATARPYIQ
jgi:hypothetical protein